MPMAVHGSRFAGKSPAHTKKELVAALVAKKIFPQRERICIVSDLDKVLLRCGGYKEGSVLCERDFVTDGEVMRLHSGTPYVVEKATFLVFLTKYRSAVGARVEIAVLAVPDVKVGKLVTRLLEHPWSALKMTQFDE